MIIAEDEHFIITKVHLYFSLRCKYCRYSRTIDENIFGTCPNKLTCSRNKPTEKLINLYRLFRFLNEI